MKNKLTILNEDLIVIMERFEIFLTILIDDYEENQFHQLNEVLVEIDHQQNVYSPLNKEKQKNVILTK